MPNRIVCVILILCCFALFGPLSAQAPKKQAFEVATVKPLPSMQSLFEEIQSGKRSQDSLKTTIECQIPGSTSIPSKPRSPNR